MDRDPPTDPGRRQRRETRLLNRKVPLRFATVVLSMAYSVAAAPQFLTLPPETVMLVLGLAGAFLGVDTLRPSGTVRE